MMIVEWVRFTWDLDSLVVPAISLPAHYSFTPAKREDEKDLREVIARSFAHDTSWGDAIHDVNGMLDGWIAQVFAPEQRGISLALRHGLRIIGAAILVPDALALQHLSPGPCVLMEYRNRGLGTALLGESLRQLRAAGLNQAAALTKHNAPAAKFLYPKFNGILSAGDSPRLAA